MHPLILSITTNCLIILAGLIVAFLLMCKKFWEAKILGLILFFAAVIFFTNVMPDILLAMGELNYDRCVAIITVTQFTIILFGLAVHFYTFLILFGRRKRFYWLLIFFLILYALFFYHTLTGQWGDIVYTSWGVEIAPPRLSLIYLFCIIFVGIAPILYIIFREAHRKIRKQPYNINRLLGMLSIAIYVIFGSLDDYAIFSGPPLVFDRMIILVGILIAFFSYREPKKSLSY